MEEGDAAIDLASASSWDIATRYHEFKAKPGMKPLAKQLRRISAQAVLDRAREILGSVVHPIDWRVSPASELPVSIDEAEIDIEETIENGLGVSRKISTEPWMEYRAPKRQALVLSVDTSLSMTGEKLALTAVALAVVLLQFPSDPIGIVAFENEAQILKRPDENISIGQLIERFLDVPAQGYTHLEEGLRVSLKLSRSISSLAKSRPPSTILLTDGKYTAGRDPGYLAPRFSHLVVIKMGKEKASLALCQELARRGSGVLKEVGQLESLAGVMYGVVKDLLRGHSLS